MKINISIKNNISIKGICQAVSRKLSKKLHTTTQKNKELEKIELKPPSKYSVKKMSAQKIADLYWKLNEITKCQAITQCGKYLEFKECLNDGYKHLINARFCRERLCPFCAWRRQRKFIIQTMKIMYHLQNEYRLIFITLTQKNCNGENLSQSIDDMLRGFKKLMNKRQVMRQFEGIIRAIEITKNEESNFYHPHLHLLVAVKKDYFKKNNDEYLKQPELATMWKECLNLDYIPLVSIEAVKDSKGAVSEVVKYQVKDFDIKDTQTLRVYDTALKYKRLIAFTGVFQKIRKTLALSDIEIVDYEDYKNESLCPRCGSKLYNIMYSWNLGAGQYETNAYFTITQNGKKMIYGDKTET